MRRIKGGILKCTRALLGQARWFIARAIDVVVPYQFLSNQLRDCTASDGQFQCPTCTDAIGERIRTGRITLHGVVHRIAKYESDNDWKITYFEMYPAVRQELLTTLNSQVGHFAERGELEGTYHKLLRKGVNMMPRVSKWIGLAVLVVGLSHLIVHHALPRYQAYQYDIDLQDTAMLVNTTKIPTWVDSLHMDYEGTVEGGIEWAAMCDRCKNTVGSRTFPAHGHTLTIQPSWYEEPQKYSKYVRTCSSE